MSLFYPLPQSYPITQQYGDNPGSYTRWNLKGHNGIDFAAPMCTPVLASADGWVEKADSDPAGYGNYVQIRHVSGDVRTVYGHLNRLDVKPFTFVTVGQQIGLSGTTGNSTGPHLHFEVRKNGLEQNGYGGAIDPSWLLDWPVGHTPAPEPGYTTTPTPAPLPAGMVRVVISRLNIRLGPGLDQPIIGGMPCGTILSRGTGEPQSDSDNITWIPVILWVAKAQNGQPLAEEGQA